MSESRATFLASLRTALRPAPTGFVDEVLADYAGHFEEGARHGRSDADIARALGDPLTLAQELLAESAVVRWQASASPRAGLRVIAQAVARGALRGSVALLALPVAALLALLLSLGSLAAVSSGVWFLLSGWAFELPGGALTVALGGVGLIAAGVSLGALTLLGAIGLVNGLAGRMRGSYQHVQRRKSGASP